MKPLNIPVEEFLRPFFDPIDKICLRVFADRKEGVVFKGMKLETTLAQMGAMVPMLKEQNALMRGIYFVVNAGGHEDADIIRVNAQFMECDDIPLEEQWARIEAFPLEPSIIVKTRKSLHTYWLLHDADVAAFRRVQKRLAAQFGGDRTCVNESRVLRLPGFNHCKLEPVMVYCVKFNPELRYTQAELEAVLPEIEVEMPLRLADSALHGTRKGLALVRRRCQFIRHCAENAATLSEADWYAMITNLAVFEDGEQAIHALSAGYPGYKAGETQEKIQHFLESGTRPMTCRTIAEKGFVCPHLQDGTCACKAPAAMCYQPLDLETLRTLLLQIPTTGKTVEDALAAQRFVQDYLYNVDALMAATFLQYELRPHLGLKAMDIKPLEGLQKELYRAWKNAKDTKRESAGDELPDWYEPTEKGGLRFLPGVLANHLAGDVNAFYGAGSYYGYDGGVYHAYEDLWASAKAREFMITRSATLNAINDVVGQWRMLIRKPVREINSNPFIINARNGLYNVLDGSFKPHTPKYYSTVQLGATYDEDAVCPQFHAFLHSVLGEPEIELMQEIFGYLLIPINKAQKSFVFVGAPNAGKSTLLAVAQEILLGSENVSNIAWQSLGDRFNKAELFGKLANIFADLPSKAIDDNGLFKALTGEDYITAERKNKDPFSFKPYARFLFSCNEIPRNYGDRSEGFYRRLVIIRFDHSVPKARRDPNLLDKLAAERDGLLMWALGGLRRLIARNYEFSETEATRAELQRYRIDSNSVLSFADEYCEEATNGYVVRSELYHRYREYCIETGLKPLSEKAFIRDLATAFPSATESRDPISKRRAWKGIQFHEEGRPQA